MTNELKKYPFCGSEVEMHRGVYSQYIMCRNKECEAMSLSNMDGAVVLKAWNTRPIEDALRAENERLKKQYEIVRAHAIVQDCGRLCDADSGINFKLQLDRSEKHIDWLAKQALETKGE